MQPISDSTFPLEFPAGALHLGVSGRIGGPRLAPCQRQLGAMRCLVVERGRFAGIVTSSDVVRAIGRDVEGEGTST